MTLVPNPAVERTMKAGLRERLAQVGRCLEGLEERNVSAGRAAAAIRAAGGCRWVGLYDVGETEIAVVAWAGEGAPANPRFPVSQGLNGAAVREGATVVVADVTKDPRYLTTFGSTRSEIVVPVKSPTTGRVVGTIDVESERTDAFAPDDRAFLEACAAVLAPLWGERAAVSEAEAGSGRCATDG